ncbi:hypothetical protein SDC9_142534 [bioreactor metagenome]|uniref:Uncharacterized protein n=1 Tax=bioreactor metagenome TaxID=1076179 RepID=A0A645E0U1_9ZZZZ
MQLFRNDFPCAENCGDSALLRERGQKHGERLELARVDAGEVGGLLGTTAEVTPSPGRGCKLLKEIVEKLRRSDAHSEHMVLMNARLDLSMPDAASPEFVEISTFGQQKVTTSQQITINFALWDFYGFHLRQVDVSVLDVCHAKIR